VHRMTQKSNCMTCSMLFWCHIELMKCAYTQRAITASHQPLGSLMYIYRHKSNHYCFFLSRFARTKIIKYLSVFDEYILGYTERDARKKWRKKRCLCIQNGNNSFNKFVQSLHVFQNYGFNNAWSHGFFFSFFLFAVDVAGLVKTRQVVVRIHIYNVVAKGHKWGGK
jgi:hypothetical protein